MTADNPMVRVKGVPFHVHIATNPKGGGANWVQISSDYFETDFVRLVLDFTANGMAEKARKGPDSYYKGKPLPALNLIPKVQNAEGLLLDVQQYMRSLQHNPEFNKAAQDLANNIAPNPSYTASLSMQRKTYKHPVSAASVDWLVLKTLQSTEIDGLKAGEEKRFDTIIHKCTTASALSEFMIEQMNYFKDIVDSNQETIVPDDKSQWIKTAATQRIRNKLEELAPELKHKNNQGALDAFTGSIVKLLDQELTALIAQPASVPILSR